MIFGTFIANKSKQKIFVNKIAQWGIRCDRWTPLETVVGAKDIIIKYLSRDYNLQDLKPLAPIFTIRRRMILAFLLTKDKAKYFCRIFVIDVYVIPKHRFEL